MSISTWGGAPISAWGGARSRPRVDPFLRRSRLEWSTDLGRGWSVGVGLGLRGDYFCDFLCGNCGVGFDMVAGVGVVVVIMCGVTVWILVYVGLIWLPELELWW